MHLNVFLIGYWNGGTFVEYLYAWRFIGRVYTCGSQFVELESSVLLWPLWDISSAHVICFVLVFFARWDILYRLLMLQDPKSSLWLWKKHEKKKQKKRTVNYQSYMDKMRLGGGDEGFDSMGHMTKNYMHKIENFLTYGQWNLDRRQIEKLKKEEERKERVGRKTFPIYGRFLTNLFAQIIQEIIDNQVEAWSIPPKKVGQDNYLGQKSRPRQLSRTKKVGQDNYFGQKK